MALILNPESGTLSGTAAEPDPSGIPQPPEFTITIPLAPFAFEGKTVKTRIVLENFTFPVLGLEGLAGKTCNFPVNPMEGYIDGSMYLGHAHNPVDCTRVAFGAVTSNSIPIVLDYAIDFTYQGPEELGILEGKLETNLAFNRKKLEKLFGRAAGNP